MLEQDWDQLGQQGWLTAVSPGSVIVHGAWQMQSDWLLESKRCTWKEQKLSPHPILSTDNCADGPPLTAANCDNRPNLSA